MSAKHLILGLDGADLSVVLTLGRSRLPALFALMDRGVFSHQSSVQPPATLPNWTTFLTGVDPGEHGVFDFTTRQGYRVRFTAGTVRAVPTWFSRLDRMGMRCACVGFPATYPPERLSRGVFISGWDSPVAFEADRTFVHPESLYALLVRRFGPMTFDEVDQFSAGRASFHARLGARLADKIARKTALASFLLAMRRWDVFAFYFGESDTAAHNLWSLFDEGSPRRPAQVTSEEALGLARVYEALDRAVGRLVREAGDDVEVTIVSDHGSGGSSDKVVHINRALEQAGLLCFRPRGRSWSLGLRGLALSKLPPPVRERAFRLGNAALPGLLESRVRFGRIDMTRTVAFSDELNYFPAVWLNVRGREPSGLVDPSHVAEARQRVTEALLSLRDPFTDRPIVHAVHPREALFSGPFLERAPDLLLELRLSRGYSYNLVPTPVDDERVVRRLGPDEYLGKKGRSLPGAHRPQGLFIAAGRTVLGRGQIESSIRDAASLTLSRIGVTPPHEAPCAGAVLAPDELRELAPAPAPSPVATRRSRLHERLRALGYID